MIEGVLSVVFGVMQCKKDGIYFVPKEVLINNIPCLRTLQDGFD